MTQQTDYTLEDFRDMLNTCPVPSRYDDWRNLSFAAKAAGLDFDTWDAWCQRGENYDAKNCNTKSWWDRIAPNGGITAGTLVFCAKQHGWRPTRGTAGDGARPDWNTPLPPVGQRRQPQGRPQQKNQGQQMKQPDQPLHTVQQLVISPVKEPGEEWKPLDDFVKYLEAVFKPGETISICTQAGFTPKYNKWHPANNGIVFLVEILCVASKKNANYCVTDVIGSYNQNAGAWIRLNPVVNGNGTNDDVADYRHALVECDGIPVEEQLARYRALNLPCSAIVHSGGKSIHAIVKIGARDAKEYSERVARLFEICKAQGIELDKANKNPSRFSRLPGVMRGNQKQYLIDTNCGAESWDAWMAWIKEQQDREAKQKASEKFEYGTGTAALDALLDDIESGEYRKVYPTGYTSLDYALHGGLRKGLYAVGGVTSLGKTAFVMQMAEQMAQADAHIRCFIVSIEMGRDDLVARSLSRIASLSGDYRQPLSYYGAGAGETDAARRCMTINDVQLAHWKRNDVAKACFRDAVDNYRAFSDRLYIWETMGRPTATLIRNEVIEYMNAYPDDRVCVYLDYLQIMGNDLGSVTGIDDADTEGKVVSGTDKQITDDNVLKLKQMARDLAIPVVVVSSFNRDSKDAAADTNCFKESGIIEYTADGLWGLQLAGAGTKEFNSSASKEDSPRKIELRILKNRRGKIFVRTGLHFDYYPAFNLFVDEMRGKSFVEIEGEMAERVRKTEEERAKKKALEEAEKEARKKK